jgi:hypothetical protein
VDLADDRFGRKRHVRDAIASATLRCPVLRWARRENDRFERLVLGVGRE